MIEQFNQFTQRIAQIQQQVNETNAFVTATFIFVVFTLLLAFVSAHRAHKTVKLAEEIRNELREFKAFLQGTKTSQPR